jgi:hypothetical protein
MTGMRRKIRFFIEFSAHESVIIEIDFNLKKLIDKRERTFFVEEDFK